MSAAVWGVTLTDGQAKRIDQERTTRHRTAKAVQKTSRWADRAVVLHLLTGRVLPSTLAALGAVLVLAVVRLRAAPRKWTRVAIPLAVCVYLCWRILRAARVIPSAGRTGA